MDGDRNNKQKIAAEGGPANGYEGQVNLVNLSNAALVNRVDSQQADLGMIATLLSSPHSKDQGLETLHQALQKSPARKLLVEPASIGGGSYL